MAEAFSDTGSRTALLVLDVQSDITARVEAPGLLQRLSDAVTAARANRVLVIYVVVGFRAGYPEVSPRNKSFSRIRDTGRLITMNPRSEVDPGIAPEDGDVVLTKRRVSAFAGSDLDVVLRAHDITTLVLGGIQTSGVVLSTLRQAADLDFELFVLGDGCADPDPEVHQVLMEKVFPRQAEVVTVADWVASLQGSPS